MDRLIYIIGVNVYTFFKLIRDFEQVSLGLEHYRFPV